MTKVRVQLPDKYDPYDKRLKATLNKYADDKNLIDVERKTPTLICGAMRDGKHCRQMAGMGTTHKGYGRCKHHGGSSTGPKTVQGKIAASQNARVHGFYSSALLPQEQEILDMLENEPVADLSNEISMWRAKLISYLTRAKDNGDIYMGSIENPVLEMAFNTLRRLVETQRRIRSADDSTDIMDAINAELRAASMGNIQLSWDSGAQHSDTNRQAI